MVKWFWGLCLVTFFNLLQFAIFAIYQNDILFLHTVYVLPKTETRKGKALMAKLKEKNMYEEDEDFGGDEEESEISIS